MSDCRFKAFRFVVPLQGIKRLNPFEAYCFEFPEPGEIYLLNSSSKSSESEKKRFTSIAAFSGESEP